MIVVDTSVWIDYLRGTETQQATWLDELIEADAGVAITDIILTELLQGAPDERSADDLEDRLLAFDLLRLEHLDDFTRAASLYRQARRQGVTIRKTSDCLIASLCVREGLAILHADSDFDQLAGCTPLTIATVP